MGSRSRQERRLVSAYIDDIIGDDLGPFRFHYGWLQALHFSYRRSNGERYG